MQHHLARPAPAACAAHACCASSTAAARPHAAANALHQAFARPLDGKHWRQRSAANRSRWQEACAPLGNCSCRSLDAPRGATGRNPLWPWSTLLEPRRPPTPGAQTARPESPCCEPETPKDWLRLRLGRLDPDLRQDGCWRGVRGGELVRSPGPEGPVARSALRLWWPSLRPRNSASELGELFSPPRLAAIDALPLLDSVSG